MNDTLVAAVVAAAVSLFVSLLTHTADKRRIRSEENRQEREIRRRLTEKLLDLRLFAYPKAFILTDKLRGDIILQKGDYVKGVLNDLLLWQRDHAGFLFTKDSLRAYRELRAALSVEPENGGYSRTQRQHIFRCKNRFRGTLKSDLTFTGRIMLRKMMQPMRISTIDLPGVNQANLINDQSHWLHRLATLQIDRARNDEAPHKLFLLLMILKMARRCDVTGSKLSLSLDL